jgi:hypothetical protein
VLKEYVLASMASRASEEKEEKEGGGGGSAGEDVHSSGGHSSVGLYTLNFSVTNSL